MAASDRIVGSAVVVEFQPTGDSTVYPITADFTAFNFNQAVDVVDVTAGNEPERYEKDTIEALDFTLNLFDANSTYLTKIKPRANGQLWIYKRGKGTGLPVISFNALFKTYSEDMPFDGALEIETTGSRRGAMITDHGSVQA
jgi:predicted ATP-dependent Lon-type protease